jgi:hypothetical protein
MDSLFQHMILVPGRVLIRRHKPGYGWGEVMRPSNLAGDRLSWTHTEFTFQKGKSHYVIALLRNTERWP